MPFVNVKVLRGLLTPEQKAELIERITDAVDGVVGVGTPEFRDGIWVVVEDIESGHWGVGGQLASPPTRQTTEST